MRILSRLLAAALWILLSPALAAAQDFLKAGRIGAAEGAATITAARAASAAARTLAPGATTAAAATAAKTPTLIAPGHPQILLSNTAILAVCLSVRRTRRRCGGNFALLLGSCLASRPTASGQVNCRRCVPAIYQSLGTSAALPANL